MLAFNDSFQTLFDMFNKIVASAYNIFSELFCLIFIVWQLFQTYPFDQGLKIFSRRSHEVDWTRLNANESKRNAEFWFETGDPQLTQ